MKFFTLQDYYPSAQLLHEDVGTVISTVMTLIFRRNVLPFAYNCVSEMKKYENVFCS